MRRPLAHRQLGDELRKSEARYRTVLDAAFDAIVIITSDGIVRWFNYGAEHIFGHKAGEVVGQPVTLLMPERYRDLCVAGLRRYLRTGEAQVMGSTIELVGLRKDGSEFPIEMSLGETHEDGERLFTGVIRYVTDRKRAESALRESEQRFRGSFERAATGMALVGTDGRFLRVNRSLCEILGYTERELLRKTFQEITHPDDLDADLDQVRRMLDGEIRTYQMEKRYIHKEGHVVWALLSVSMVHDEEGEPLYFVSQIQDISERKALEERLEHRAFHDALTDLPNRQLFMDRLGQALRRTMRRHKRVAVLFMDIDKFKGINDSLGHEVGDLLLKVVARRLGHCLRPEDTLARFGGDEFVVLIEAVDDSEQAVEVAERITEEFRKPFNIEGRDLYVTASIGISLGNARTHDSDGLLREADTAMYRAKDETESYTLFDPSMYALAFRRLELENDLRQAIEQEEFVVHYQ